MIGHLSAGLTFNVLQVCTCVCYFNYFSANTYSISLTFEGQPHQAQHSLDGLRLSTGHTVQTAGHTLFFSSRPTHISSSSARPFTFRRLSPRTVYSVYTLGLLSLEEHSLSRCLLSLEKSALPRTYSF
jgi:hypothetical protein